MKNSKLTQSLGNEEGCKFSVAACKRICAEKCMKKKENLAKHTSILGTAVGSFEGKKLGWYEGKSDGCGNRKIKHNNCRQTAMEIILINYYINILTLTSLLGNTEGYWTIYCSNGC